MWLDESRSNVLRRVQNPGWRRGYFEHQPLRDLTAQIFLNYRASPHFGLVTVELPFLRTHLISGTAATADHLLATASIPVALPFVTIGGKIFTDGGLLEDVPLWAAIEMGATQIVAIDAMHFDCPWWYRAGVSPMGLFAPRLRSISKTQITLIRPSRPLGNYSDAISWKRERIQNWLDLGYTDARRAFAGHDIPACARV
jgi:NTE family protein